MHIKSLGGHPHTELSWLRTYAPRRADFSRFLRRPSSQNKRRIGAAFRPRRHYSIGGDEYQRRTITLWGPCHIPARRENHRFGPYVGTEY
jgi:hypothetical protein